MRTSLGRPRMPEPWQRVLLPVTGTHPHNLFSHSLFSRPENEI